jgi:multimeric flavodoxin WrbA
MNALVLSASPNTDGLTAACAAAVLEGVRQGGGQVELVCLNDADIGMCKACDNGWGTCLLEHSCQVQDGFQSLHTRACQADALALVTPVYWGQMSESAKAFTDRLRRCEATRGDESRLRGKPILVVAAAGGSGGGMITCLLTIEQWIQHVRAEVFDLLPVNRWSRSYKLAAIQEAARKMISNREYHAEGR